MSVGRHNFFKEEDSTLQLNMDPGNFKSFQEEIKSSFSSIMNSADAFVAVDYDLCFLYINAKAEKLYQRNKNLLIGYKIEQVFPELWNFGPFKNAMQSVVTRKNVEINYHSPTVKEWIHLIGRPFENYYTFTYRVIDPKQSLKEELRKEVRKDDHPIAKW